MLVSKAKRLFIKSPDLWENSCLKIMKDDHANSSAANYELNYEFVETDCNPYKEKKIPRLEHTRQYQQPKARNERPNSQKRGTSTPTAKSLQSKQANT